MRSTEISSNTQLPCITIWRQRGKREGEIEDRKKLERKGWGGKGVREGGKPEGSMEGERERGKWKGEQKVQLQCTTVMMSPHQFTMTHAVQLCIMCSTPRMNT